jgi:hypothetical protein
MIESLLSTAQARQWRSPKHSSKRGETNIPSDFVVANYTTSRIPNNESPSSAAIMKTPGININFNKIMIVRDQVSDFLGFSKALFGGLTLIKSSTKVEAHIRTLTGQNSHCW